MNSDSQTTSGRRQLSLIVLIAGLSLAGAYLLFLAVRDSNGWGTTNNGVFVEPARVLADLDIRDESGNRVDAAGVWLLWVLTSAPCSAQCEQAMQQLRALHTLLNKDADRVRRGLVMNAGAGGEQLRQRYPEVAFLTGTVDGLASGIYIVDPIGNLVFWYPFAAAGEPVLDDLKRLLKVSQIG
jgi:cytochrome oxidase Cu insertion factor (SCO1/SenC/PrrC family)